MGIFELAVATAVVLVLIVLFFGGAIQTFRRQPIVAILCIIFIFPVWLIWAFVEMFLPRPRQ